MSQPPKPPFGTANFDDAVVVESVTYSTTYGVAVTGDEVVVESVTYSTDVTASFGDEVSTG
jgi:hypothetical protein